MDAAVASLKRALYLDSDFVPAHFMLGNISWQRGKFRESRKYLSNALTLIEEVDPASVLNEVDGLTAGHLKKLILSMLNCGMDA